MIEVLCRSERDALVLEVVGDLGASTAPMLEACLEAALDSDAAAVVVDLRRVDHVDRQGALALLGAASRYSKRGHGFSVRNLDGCRSDVAGLEALVSPRDTKRRTRLLARPDVVLGGLAARGGGSRTTGPPPRPAWGRP